MQAATTSSLWTGWERLTPLLHYANFYDATPGGSFGPRYIQEFQLLLVQAGNGSAIIGAEEFQIRRNDVLFYGPNVVHTVTSSIQEPLKLIGLVFLFCQQDQQRLHADLPHAQTQLFPFPDGPLSCPLQPYPATRTSLIGVSRMRHYCETVVLSYIANPTERLLEKRGLLFQIFEEWYQSFQSPSCSSSLLTPYQQRVIQQAQALLLNEFVCPPSLEQLASMAGWGKTYFARLFKQETGNSVHDFILQQRLLYARQLLVEGVLQVSEVAHAVGFEDAFYFSRLFKQRLGVAPSQLRKTLII